MSTPKSLIATLGADFAEAFAVDENAEDVGVWHEVPNNPGWRVRLRCHWSDRMQDKWQRLSKRLTSAAMTKGGIPTAEYRAVQARHLTDNLVVAWEGFNGVPCTRETVAQLCRETPRFVDWAWARANDRDAYNPALTADELEDVAGNFAPSSATP